MLLRCGGAVIDTGGANSSKKRRLTGLLLVTLLAVPACLYLLARGASPGAAGAAGGDLDDEEGLGVPIDSVLRPRGGARGGAQGVVKGSKGVSMRRRSLDADMRAVGEGEDEGEGEEIIVTSTAATVKQGRRTKSQSANVIQMVMEAARANREQIVKNHYELVRNQHRAPDSRYNINVTFSDLLSPDRPVRDTRPPPCFNTHYNLSDLPTATVVMPFYNEALSMILRAVHSILNRSPDVLLDEIILVDDHSPDQHLQAAALDGHVALLPKVRIIHNPSRVGLVVARMNGFRLAKSPIVVFLDAHTEVNAGWLEPLCDELKRNPRQILQPFIDGIDAMNLDYAAPGIYHKGAFSWDLRYTWIKQPDHEQARALETGLPFATPTMVGCAIGVNKQFFAGFGAFDESLLVWGGENTELSFRTWMCGSQLMTVTCSRIGHVFKEFPYSFDGNKEDIVQKNLIRVAETWMDSLKKFFYATTRVYPFKRTTLTSEEMVTLQQRKDLRKQLKCHNFEWFLYNIIPEMDVPRMDAQFYGEIMGTYTRGCWEVTDDYYVGLTYMCYHHKIIPKNSFALTNDGLLRYRDKCVTIAAPNPMLILAECPSDPTNRLEVENYSVWELEKQDVVWGFIKVRRRNAAGVLEHWCVVQVTNAMPAHKGEQMPQLGACDDKDRFQMWAFTYGFDWGLVPNDTLTHVLL